MILTDGVHVVSNVNLEELHKWAAKHRLAPSRFHRGRHPHYDLPRPGCTYHCGRRARKGMRFCGQRCAAEWAENIAAGNDTTWCDICQDWTIPELQCQHHPISNREVLLASQAAR